MSQNNRSFVLIILEPNASPSRYSKTKDLHLASGLDDLDIFLANKLNILIGTILILNLPPVKFNHFEHKEYFLIDILMTKSLYKAIVDQFLFLQDDRMSFFKGQF